MSQLTRKNDQESTEKKQNTQHIHLGKAPDDIYGLEAEIEALRCENTSVDQRNEESEESKYELFSTANISEAKQSLQNGSKIKLKLPNKPTPHQIIAIAHNIGLDTYQLQKVFQNSSVVLKNILDDYVSKTQAQYASLSSINHPYQSSANGGYLFHCKKVDALQCDTDLSAKLRISMNLNYHQIVKNDDLFQTKFVYELCHNVFKCPVNCVRVMDIRAGSIIVIIAGITLVTLATVGLLKLSVKLHQRRKLQSNNKSAGCENENKAIVMKEKSKSNAKSLKVNKYKEIKHMKSAKRSTVSDTFVSSLFNSIKTGINSLTEQYLEPETTAHDMDDVCAQLLQMGFDPQMSQQAAKKYPSDINEAINWITEHQNEEQEIQADDNAGACAQTKENLLLYMNDALWVRRKNNFWSATVVALTRDSVTVEYDSGGPYLWKKTETFALNDECLEQRQPGMQMSPSIEGCVEITKTNGGLIKAWKRGLNRPMADI